MEVNFLTSGNDKSRHGLLLEEISEKRPITLQAAFQIIEPDYRLPRPMKPGRPPSFGYYEYHEDTCHTTEQYFQLRNLIENKICRGQLVHYVKHNDVHRQDHRNDDDRVINVIFGGVAAGGLSNNSRNNYAREMFNINPSAVKHLWTNPSPVIFLSEDDYRPGLLEGHQDALIITTRVGNKTVKKILVDNGSSIDILYHHTFARMDLGDRRFENSRIPLYGFTGNEVHVVGNCRHAGSFRLTSTPNLENGEVSCNQRLL
ncbi:uncharacterized protein LOC141719007 [Apium graveolens]|uniref:uncharacterized protein LOC141719007 n=1 Tax=Apium graveolens TaxID=4045 RepID=UPI003D7AA929